MESEGSVERRYEKVWETWFLVALFSQIVCLKQQLGGTWHMERKQINTDYLQSLLFGCEPLKIVNKI